MSKITVPDTASSSTSMRVSRAEFVWLAIAILLGTCLRSGALSTIAVEHFDEAVYASNLLFSAQDGGEFPMRQLYAPPLLPAAIEWSTIVGQMFFGTVPNWWPMLPVLLAGWATIPSAWWIVRQWFGSSTGIAAALLVATDEFHASYSRTALTDVPLSLFVLWAVYWCWYALRTGATQPTLLAGLFTALAWWTKYNGWLPLAIAASGGTLWQLVIPSRERNWTRLTRTWLMITATAALLWSPVLWDCQKVGGYGKVVENHRSYINGISHWFPNAVRGVENLDEFLGWLTLAGIGITLVIRLVPARFRPATDAMESQASDPILAECLLAAWFWGLVFATPMYHPYSRLWAPCWLAANIALAVLITRPKFPPLHALNFIPSTCVRAAGGVALIVVLWSALNLFSSPSCFDRRDGFFQAAQQIQQRIPSNQSVIIVGDSDPALWFQLRRVGMPAFLQSSFEFADQSQPHAVYVALGPLSQRLEGIQRAWRLHSDRFELVEEFSFSPSRVALLDLFSPQELAANPQLRGQKVALYRLRP